MDKFSNNTEFTPLVCTGKDFFDKSGLELCLEMFIEHFKNCTTVETDKVRIVENFENISAQIMGIQALINFENRNIDKDIIRRARTILTEIYELRMEGKRHSDN